jgi:hypothetical protein
LSEKNARDDEAGDDEEHVYTNVTPNQMKVARVKKHHQEDGDTSQALNVGAECPVLWSGAARVDELEAVTDPRHDLAVTDSRARGSSTVQVHFRNFPT